MLLANKLCQLWLSTNSEPELCQCNSIIKWAFSLTGFLMLFLLQKVEFTLQVFLLEQLMVKSEILENGKIL